MQKRYLSLLVAGLQSSHTTYTLFPSEETCGFVELSVLLLRFIVSKDVWLALKKTSVLRRIFPHTTYAFEALTNPDGPGWPCVPLNPRSPCIPCGPIVPVAPVSPLGPCGPGGPCGPCGPAGQVDPVGQ